MSDVEIPKDRWHDLCADLTRRFQGQAAVIRQLRTADLQGDGAGEVRSNLLLEPARPLYEVRAGRAGEQTEVMVTVRDGHDDTSFLIEDAVALFSRRSGDDDTGLRVDSGNGTSTLLEFHEPGAPDPPTGLVEGER
jgi:hypothetical protein